MPLSWKDFWLSGWVNDAVVVPACVLDCTQTVAAVVTVNNLAGAAATLDATQTAAGLPAFGVTPGPASPTAKASAAVPAVALASAAAVADASQTVSAVPTVEATPAAAAPAVSATPGVSTVALTPGAASLAAEAAAATPAVEVDPAASLVTFEADPATVGNGDDSVIFAAALVVCGAVPATVTTSGSEKGVGIYLGSTRRPQRTDDDSHLEPAWQPSDDELAALLAAYQYDLV